MLPGSPRLPARPRCPHRPYCGPGTAPRTLPALPRPLAPGGPPRSPPAAKVGSPARRGGERSGEGVRGRGQVLSRLARRRPGRGIAAEWPAMESFFGRGWYLPGAADQSLGKPRVALRSCRGCRRLPEPRSSAGQRAGAALACLGRRSLWRSRHRRSCHAGSGWIAGSGTLGERRCDDFISAARIALRYRGAGSIVLRTVCVQIQKRQE